MQEGKRSNCIWTWALEGLREKGDDMQGDASWGVSGLRHILATSALGSNKGKVKSLVWYEDW